jgi:twitching motility protein PilI
MPTSIDPYSLLADIERKSISLAQGLPAREDVIELWNGIGFSLAGHRFVASMGEVVEVLSVPRYTMIPGVQKWLNGVANVRGRLLPILDLAHFFGLSHKGHSTRERRVLVIERGEVFSGLIVDSVLGMQYFPMDSLQADISDAPDQMKDFVTGCYERSQDRWNVFSTKNLVADEKFLTVAES